MTKISILEKIEVFMALIDFSRSFQKPIKIFQDFYSILVINVKWSIQKYVL